MNETRQGKAEESALQPDDFAHLSEMSAHLPRGIPAVAEALGYVGGALALGASIALLVRYWTESGPYGHIGVGVLLAVVGLVGGLVLGRLEGDAAKRLSQFLLFAGVAGVGIAVGFAARRVGYLYLQPVQGSTEPIMESVDEWAWFVGAAAVAIVGGLIWRRHHTVLQHLAFAFGVAATALAALRLTPIESDYWAPGAVMAVVALIWGELSLKDLVPPRVVGLVLSALGIVVGLEMIVISDYSVARWAMWHGVVACVALIWGGSRLEELGVLGIGTVGLMLFSGQRVSEYLGFGAGTARALIAIGFVLLGVGVRLTLKLEADAAQSRRIAAEVAGYLGIALAMGGAGILVTEYWDELGVAGHIAVPLVEAVVAYACALVLERTDAPSARRMSQVLFAIGVLAAGITGAMIAEPITKSIFGEVTWNENTQVPQVDRASNWTVLMGMLTAALVGGATWRLRNGSLTQVALVASLVGVITAVMGFAPLDGTTATLTMGGIALLALGTIWVVVGALERIPPVRTALVMGSLTLLAGLQMLAWSSGEGTGFRTWAALLGVAYGIAGIVASIYLKRGTLLGFGAGFVIIFSMTLVLERFQERASEPLMVLAAGLVFIVVAVVVAKLAPTMWRTSVPEPAATSE